MYLKPQRSRSRPRLVNAKPRDLDKHISVVEEENNRRRQHCCIRDDTQHVRWSVGEGTMSLKSNWAHDGDWQHCSLSRVEQSTCSSGSSSAWSSILSTSLGTWLWLSPADSATTHKRVLRLDDCTRRDSLHQDSTLTDRLSRDFCRRREAAALYQMRVWSRTVKKPNAVR